MLLIEFVQQVIDKAFYFLRVHKLVVTCELRRIWRMHK